MTIKPHLSRQARVSVACFSVALVSFLIIRSWFPSVPRFAALSLVGALLGADTQYAPGFHPLSWDRIRVGDFEDELYARFGQPLVTGNQSWVYDWDYDHLGLTLTLNDRRPDGGNVIKNSYDHSKNQDVDVKYQGMSADELRLALGKPSTIEKRLDTITLFYSTPRGGFGKSDYIRFIV